MRQWLYAVIVSGLSLSQPVFAEIYGAIIIDDIGYNTISAKRIAQMPFPITCAVLPEAPSSQKAANILNESGKELMLHLPMQGRSGEAQEINVLTADMDEQTFKAEVRRHLDLMPFVSGLNNHQGSILTTSDYPMNWLMEELSLIDEFYFIDSRTTGGSVAVEAAQTNRVPFAIRDVFLDHERDEAFISKQLQSFIRIAKQEGSAIAIGHPYHETLKVLEQTLPQLEEEGITLVYASSLVSVQMAQLHHEPAQQSAQLSPELQ